VVSKTVNVWGQAGDTSTVLVPTCPPVRETGTGKVSGHLWQGDLGGRPVSKVIGRHLAGPAPTIYGGGSGREGWVILPVTDPPANN
jgi:hypothetical protein